MCLCWPVDESYLVAFVGYTTVDVVRSALVWVGVIHPYHVVWMADLDPMGEFYQVVGNGLMLGVNKVVCDLGGNTCNHEINGFEI